MNLSLCCSLQRLEDWPLYLAFIFQVPNDLKALFRRCQAYEALGQIDAAYNDAKHVHNMDPKSKDIEQVLIRLHKAVSQKVSTYTSPLSMTIIDCLFSFILQIYAANKSLTQTAA